MVGKWSVSFSQDTFCCIFSLLFVHTYYALHRMIYLIHFITMILQQTSKLITEYFLYMNFFIHFFYIVHTHIFLFNLCLCVISRPTFLIYAFSLYICLSCCIYEKHCLYVFNSTGPTYVHTRVCLNLT